MAFGGNNRFRLLLVILLVTSLFLITLDLRGVNVTKGTRSATQSFLAPIQRGFSGLISPVTNFLSDVKNFGKTKAELQDVKAANAKLRAQVVVNQDIQGQLKQLKSVLDLSARGSFKTASARVIGRGSSSTFSQTVTLDAGSAKGIYPDMTVISDGGIVGVVKAVTRSSSIVLLMSDPTFKVGVRIAGTQSAGVLIGQGSSKYLLQLLDANGTINVGDSLVTLGSDNNRPFVPGVPVGKVVKVSTTSASVTQEALVEGFSNLNALGVVSVILSTSGKDLKDQLLPSPPATRSPVPSPTPSVKPTPGASKKA